MSGLSEKQQRAIEAVLGHGTLAEAAEAVRVTPRTLRRWLSDETFQRELKSARARVMDGIVNRLASLGSKAVAELDSILSNKRTKPGIRLRAALGILQHVQAAREADLEARLAEIEKQLQVLEQEVQ
jgi:DNA-binding transcriptional MerR regulator